MILFRFYLYFLVFYLKFPIFLVFCGILYGFLGIYLDFIVFVELKGCLHKLSNYLFWVIWSHDLANLFEFLEPPRICLAHSVLIWLYIIFFSNFLNFFGIFRYLWHQKTRLHKLKNSQKGNLINFSEFSGICLDYSGLIWFYLDFTIILWIFLGFFGICSIKKLLT